MEDHTLRQVKCKDMELDQNQNTLTLFMKHQIGINQMYEEIEEDFELFGELEGEFERFRKNIN